MGDLGSIPGLGRSPGGGNGYPLQYSCLENSMDRGAWKAMVHGATKSQIQLSNFHFQGVPRFSIFPSFLLFCLWTPFRSRLAHTYGILISTLHSWEAQISLIDLEGSRVCRQPPSPALAHSCSCLLTQSFPTL